MIRNPKNKLGLNYLFYLDCYFYVVDATIQRTTYITPDKILINGAEVAFTIENNKIYIGKVFAGISFTLEIQKDGYITYIQTYNYTSLNNTTIGLSPSLSEGAIRVILTWNETPADVDSHTYVYNDSTQLGHSYWNNKIFTNENTTVTLDKDDTTSYGPETTTIDPCCETYTYKFNVHDYTNRKSTDSKALSNSGSKIEIYKGNSLKHTINIPTNVVGIWWKVFEYKNGEFTIINTVGNS